MSGSLNRVTLIGNVGADPEIRTTGSGNKCANLRIACTESWTKDGEKKEKTEWISVVIWNEGLVGVVERYVKKGSKIYVEGKFSTRKWEDQDGKDRYTTEVVIQGFGGQILLLGDPRGGDNGGRSDDRRGGGGSSGGYDRGSSGGSYGGGKAADGYDLDDTIPFATSSSGW